MRSLGDLGHRVLWTFVETFTGFLVADPIIAAIGGNLELAVWQTAVGSSLAAALVPVKEYARARGARARTSVGTDE